MGRHCSDNSDHLVVPPATLMPGSSLLLQASGTTFVPTKEHSCDIGNLTSISRVWYYPRNVVRLGDPTRSLIHLELNLPENNCFEDARSQKNLENQK